MKKRYLPTAFGVALLSAGVIAYNYWSLSTGRCTLATLFSLGPPAIILLFCNFVAFLVYFGIRTRNRNLHPQQCSCGNTLHQSWHFCPCCGSSSSQVTSS